jgi:hypothetical protein
MKLANFRAVDPLHTSQGKRGLSRGGHGVEEVWAEFAERPGELQALTTAIRAAAGSHLPSNLKMTMTLQKPLQVDCLPVCAPPENEAESWFGENGKQCFVKPGGLLVRHVGLTSQKNTVCAAKASSKCITCCHCTRFRVDQNPTSGPGRHLRQLPSNDSRQAQMALDGVEGASGEMLNYFNIANPFEEWQFCRQQLTFG